jgi:hypothetical protein
MYVLVGQNVCFSTPRPIVAYGCHNLVKEVWNMVVVLVVVSFLALFFS